MIATNLTALPSLLRLTTLTALLLTANWSSDTNPARKAFVQAEGFAPCPSIQFLELDVSEHLTRPTDDADDEDDPDDPVTRLVADPPYLPFVRVLRNLPDGKPGHHQGEEDNTSTRAHVPSSLVKDYFSVDPLPLAHFLSTLCNDNNPAPFPHLSTRDEISIAVREGGKAAVLIDHEPFTASWNRSYDALTQAGYTISYALAGRDDPFIEAYSAPVPGILLVDGMHDRFRVVDVMTGLLERAILEFDRGGDGWERERASPIKALRYFEAPAAWRVHFEEVTPIGLEPFLGERAVPNGGKESVLWVFVIDRSCAFCQRSLPEFEAFLKEVRDIPGVHAVIVRLDELPGWLDAYVDGFPTVLLLREVDTGVGVWSGAVEYLARREVSEFMDFVGREGVCANSDHEQQAFSQSDSH